MAIDRNKLLQNAEKLVRQGKLSQAVTVYEQLLDASPKDMNLKNKVGDLLVRAERVPDAIRTYTEVAEHYAEEGFYLKAIAVHKKVNRLDQTHIDCYFKLADLYSRQGLNNDAKIQFQQVADLYAKEGNSTRAAEALEQLLKLDPENIKMRIRLSEHYTQLGKPERAQDEYRAVGDELAKKQMFEEAIKIYEKGLAIHDGHAGLAGGLCRALVALDRMDAVTDRARGFQNRYGGNAEMLEVVGEVYMKARQRQAAAAVYQRLATLQPDNAAWGKRLEQLSSGPQTAPEPSAPVPDFSEMSGDFSMEELQEVSGEWAATDELAPDALEPDAALGSAEPGRDEFIVEHMTEADVFIKYGLVEKAIDNLEAIVGRYPDEIESLRRLKDLHLEAGNKAKAAEKCVALAGLARSRGDMSNAMELLAEARAHNPSVSVSGAPAALKAPDTGGSIPVTDEVISGGDGPSQAPVELESGTPTSGVELEFDLTPEETPAEVSFDAVDGPDEHEFGTADDGGDAIEFHLDDDEQDATGIEVDLDGGANGVGTHARSSAASPAGEPDEGDLAEVDFYSEQGFLDEARKRLESLRQRFPGSQRVAEKLAKQGAAPVVVDTNDEGIEFFDDAIKAPRREPAAVDPFPTSAEESPFDIGPPPEGGFEESDESLFDQETEFLAEAVDAPAEAEMPIGGGAAMADDSLEEIFKEFKKGVEAQLDTEDYETHYNLGIAYREMGLTDEAIAEFQLASKDPNKFLECCSNLGLCFREKGMPKLAIKWYTKALTAVEIGSPESIAVLYDLGEASEETGDKEKALERFIDVFGLDASYRDVAEKIRKLEDES